MLCFCLLVHVGRPHHTVAASIPNAMYSYIHIYIIYIYISPVAICVETGCTRIVHVQYSLITFIKSPMNRFMLCPPFHSTLHRQEATPKHAFSPSLVGASG